MPSNQPSLNQLLSWIGLLACALLAATQTASAATLTSSVNRNSISINETLNLTLDYSEQVDSSAINLNELARDFEVLSSKPQSSSSISIFNGQTTRIASTNWQIILAPKRQGRLLIPSFEIGAAQSQPIDISVGGSVASSTREQAPIIVKVKIDRGQAFINQQFLVTVELNAAANVSNLNGERFAVEGAEVELLDQQSSQQIENGLARQVVKWTYTLFATEAKRLTLPRQQFTGLIGARRSLFNNLGGRSQQVLGRSKSREIEVLAIPADAAELPDGGTAPAWFPARDVQIKSSWSGNIKTVRVGEPITRIIEIVAQQQRASVIPPLDQPTQPTSYKSYPDQAQLENRKSNVGIIGVRKQAEAIVPAEEGELVLPEQTVNWWNTRSKKWQRSVLPAETLQVAASDLQILTQPPANQSLGFAEDALTPALKQQATQLFWWQIATLLLAFICLLQFVLLWRISRTPGSAKPQTKTPSELSEASAWKNLQKSFKSSEPRLTRNKLIRDSLVAWGQTTITGSQHINLQQLASMSEQQGVREQLQAFEQQLYSNTDRNAPEMNSEALQAALNSLRKELKLTHNNAAKTSNDIVPLYPQ